MEKKNNRNILYVNPERNIPGLVPHFIKKLLKNSLRTCNLMTAFQGILQQMKVRTFIEYLKPSHQLQGQLQELSYIFAIFTRIFQ